MRGRPTKTPERVAQARRLRDEGLLLREIAEHFGVASSTADAWLNDPDGKRLRARKDSYAKPCVDCGAPTSGGEGRRESPLCLGCAAIRAGAARKVWTREAIIAAIRDWAREYGEPPAMADWSPYIARQVYHHEARALRFELAENAYPWVQTAIEAFGTWNAAITVAGFEPRAPHGGDGNELRKRARARP